MDAKIAPAAGFGQQGVKARDIRARALADLDLAFDALADIAARALVHARQDRLVVAANVEHHGARRLDGLIAAPESERREIDVIQVIARFDLEENCAVLPRRLVDGGPQFAHLGGVAPIHERTIRRIGQPAEPQRKPPQQDLHAGDDLPAGSGQRDPYRLPAKRRFEVAPGAQLQQMGARMGTYEGVPRFSSGNDRLKRHPHRISTPCNGIMPRL